ncbi:MAG: hypothetical protein O2887_03855 [Bacteroidetes bacterium]|nr:hypothetical protein [Bacteroidota bacterium]MDA1119621.1 hypothetical protein [Bacteroidota bacterium]
MLVKESSLDKLKIAHHMHCTAQLKIALRWGIPSILLIRNPIDAVVSLMLRDPDTSYSTAIKWYIRFYKDLKAYKDQLIICHFDNVINDHLRVISILKRNCPSLNLNKEINLKSLFDKIDELDNSEVNSITPKMVSSRPNSEKKEEKEKIIQQIPKTDKNNKLLSEAEELYSYYRT